MSNIRNKSSEETRSKSDAKRQAEARQAITSTLAAVGSSIDRETQLRATDLHANSAVIGKQQKDMAKQTAKLGKQSAQWDKALTKSSKQLNEIGDLQNWAEVLERDLLILEHTLELAENHIDSGAGFVTREF